MTWGGSYRLELPEEPVLSVRGVSKSFARGLARGLARAARRTVALSSVDLELRRGEVLGVVGPEGAGKTTLLQCVCGLLRFDCGEILLHGESFAGGGCIPQIAYVPAVPVFYPFLTVRDVLEYRAARENVPSNRRFTLIDSALDVFGLRERESCQVALLSRMEIKRLAVAEGMVGDPAAIVVDTAPCDAVCLLENGGVALAGLAGGSPMIIAARDVSSVAAVVTRLLVLDAGRVSRSFTAAPVADQAFGPLRDVLFVAERVH